MWILVFIFRANTYAKEQDANRIEAKSCRTNWAHCERQSRKAFSRWFSSRARNDETLARFERVHCVRVCCWQDMASPFRNTTHRERCFVGVYCAQASSKLQEEKTRKSRDLLRVSQLTHDSRSCEATPCEHLQQKYMAPVMMYVMVILYYNHKCPQLIYVLQSRYQRIV